MTVLGVGLLARRLIKSDLDVFLSGRSLPAWITGLAFISANLGALEILGMAANGEQYGVATVHFYWIGAIPAIVFLGVVMISEEQVERATNLLDVRKIIGGLLGSTG